MLTSLFWVFAGGICYTYLVYPLLLALLARLRPKPHFEAALTPSLTLLITAYNEQAVIGNKLENSLGLDYPADRLQILVAADGSNDHTVDRVLAYADRGVELSYRQPRLGKAAAINRAMQRARGEVVIFSDANNCYDRNALRELVAPFVDPTVGSVCGAKSVWRHDGALGEAEGLYWRYEARIKEEETRLGCCTAVAGEILALRRVLFEPLPSGIINDDFYIALSLIRRGYRIVYAPKARSFERVSHSARDEITRRARMVAGRYQAMGLAWRLLPRRRPLVIWQLISHKFLRPLVPLAMIGMIGANVLALLQPVSTTDQALLHLAFPYNWLLLALQGGFYGLAWLGSHLHRTSGVAKLCYLPTFLVNSNYAALIGLYRFLAGRHTAPWSRVQRRESLLREP